MKYYTLLAAAVLLALGTSDLWAGDAAAGKAKFDMLCVACHGPTGKGDGPAGAALQPKPRDLSSAEWQAAAVDTKIAKAIKEGGAAVGLSPLMPPWGPSLTDADIDNLVAFIRSLKGK